MNANTTPAAVPLWPALPPASAPNDAFQPWLDVQLHEEPGVRGAVLVIPGGGYQRRVHEKEGDWVAERFRREGWHSFVLHYRVAPHRHPAPLLDGQRALRLIRARAAEWNVDPARVAVCGFSAGGHLAASLGVWGEPGDGAADDPLARCSSRADACIPCYPVILAGQPGADPDSIANLLGPGADAAARAAVSLERHVSGDTPPCFLWHTADDAVVPVENSLRFAAALSRAGVPFELHVFPHGRHGLALADRDPWTSPRVARWLPLCCEWLRGLGW